MMDLPPSAFAADQMLKTLRTYREGSILHVELNTPELGNVVTEAMLDDLLSVLGNQDPEVRVLVLSAAGDDFCLGGDRQEFAEQLADDASGRGIRTSGVKARRVCDALTGNDAVTIARVQGRAIGAGMALALACDLRAACESATFRLPEIALGLPTAWGGLLPRLISEVGAARVRELVFTGRAFDAAEARALSVVQSVVPEEELDEAIAAWARPLARRPLAGLRVTKTLLHAFTTSARLADVSALDAELMAAVVSETHRQRSDGR